MRVYKIILMIILAAIIISAGSLFYIRFLIFTPANAQGETQEFVIEEGQGATAIATNLKNEGLIKSKFAFQFYVIWKRKISSLQAGTFELSSAMNSAEILSIISGNENRENRFTIIEGERLIEIAQNLEEKEIVSYKDFMEAVSNESILKSEPASAEATVGKYDFLLSIPKTASLEGFIFPDTYNLAKDSKASDIVKLTIDNFSEKIEPHLSKIEKSKYSLFQIIIIASIVEREAAKNEDRAKIASVYYNRLTEKMKLEADPTVQYAKGNWEKITVQDYRSVDSPYNTYLNVGLPPGPICNPGLPSIEAAVTPAKTDYFYFLHLEDGTTIFSKTKKEHDAAKAKYRLTGQR